MKNAKNVKKCGKCDENVELFTLGREWLEKMAWLWESFIDCENLTKWVKMWESEKYVRVREAKICWTWHKIRKKKKKKNILSDEEAFMSYWIAICLKHFLWNVFELFFYIFLLLRPTILFDWAIEIVYGGWNCLSHLNHDPFVAITTTRFLKSQFTSFV